MAAEYIEDLKIPLLKMDNANMAKQFDFFHRSGDAADGREPGEAERRASLS